MGLLVRLLTMIVNPLRNAFFQLDRGRPGVDAWGAEATARQALIRGLADAVTEV